jgi:hypothetical protein
MTDYKTRQIESRLRAFAGHFKAVLVVGARQVGKSTLLAHVFPSVKSVTFDPNQDIYGARRDPDLFLDSFPPPPILDEIQGNAGEAARKSIRKLFHLGDSFPPPLILDEIQYAPELLPALKRRMDTNPSYGQYFLSGSQQLALLRDVNESMAGRVGILHLDPMTPYEILGAGGEQPWIERHLKNPGGLSSIVRGYLPPNGGISRQLWRGSMPGVIDMPDDLVTDYYRSYVETYVERDIRRQGEIKDLMEFGRFLGIAGAMSAQEINASQFGREIGVSPRTARHWLDMLAACYQWRELHAYSGNAVKRVSSKRKGYIVDSGLMCRLQRISSPDALTASPFLGAVFETFVASFLLSQTALMPMAPQAWHWRSVGGAEVDLIFELDGKLYPIEIKCKHALSGHDTRGLNSFRATYPDKAMPGVIVYAGPEAYRLSEHVVAVPWNTR